MNRQNKMLDKHVQLCKCNDCMRTKRLLVTEGHVRRALDMKLRGRTRTATAKEIGVTLNFLSMVANGAPVTGKVLGWLGYKKVRTRLYEPLEDGVKQPLAGRSLLRSRKRA